MPRFPVSHNQINDNVATILGDDYRHVVKVLRLGKGDRLTLFDSNSVEHYGLIESIGKREVVVRIAESRAVDTDPLINITLLQGMAKGDKMDYVVEKATELGVNTIVPVITERSQTRNTNRVERWRRIAVEASKQCGRTKPTVLEDTLDFKTAINIYYNNRGLSIILHVDCELSVKDYFGQPLPLSHNNITILVGPEGGLTEKEILLAKEMDFIPLGIGPRILRTETASLTILSIVQFLYGDL